MNFLTENKIEQYADLVSRIEEVTAEKSPLCRLWQAKKESSGIRRYQAEHRQHFKAGERASTRQGNRARIRK